MPMVSNQVWTNWTTSVTSMTAAYNTVTSTATATTAIWDNWNATFDHGGTVTYQVTGNFDTINGVVNNYTVAQEVGALRRAEEALRRAFYASTSAEDRAWATLEEMLNDEQRQQLRTERRIIVPVRNLEFHIHTDQGASGNVRVHQNGLGYVGTLCAHPDLRPDRTQSRIPHADVLLSQLMAIIAQPEVFLERANVHRGSRPVLAAA